MKKIIIYIICSLPFTIYGQTYILESAKVSFFSEAPLENIDASTHTARSIYDSKTGNIAFTIPINTFEFKKSLMQQHFNENYMESEKYPNATFSGKIIPFKNLPAKEKVMAEGILTIHGISNEVSIGGILEQRNGKILMKAKFPVKLADYNIKIPRVVFFNIAEVVEVDVEFYFKEQTEI